MAITVNLTDRSEAGAPITAAQYNTTIQAIETAFAGATADADFTPVETLVGTALQPADITSGTITPFTGDLDMSGGADGEVLTVQADGSAAWEAFPGGGDMLAATYDPQTIEDDAFALSTHTGTVSTSQIADNAVTNDKIRDCAALSVIGNTTNGSAGPADISTTAGSLHVLREASNVIGFGALSTAYITSGTFADARIAESNVTQHEAAIDHDALTNFVANEHINHTNVSLTAGTGISSTGLGDLTESRTINLANTAVTPGSYTLASITVDQQGRLTAASSGSGVDATGSLVATSTGVLAVTTASHALHKNVLLTSDQASSVFTIEKVAAAGVMFAFAVQHDTCTIVIEDNAGSINGVSSATARLINGGFVVARVMSNAGSAPVIAAIGNLVVAPTTVSSTKTYDLDDHGGTYVLDGSSGTQTFDTAVASMFAGYEVMIVNDSGANRTIAGLDASHTLSDNGFVTVTKMGASLLAVGSDGVTVLDAA